MDYKLIQILPVHNDTIRAVKCYRDHDGNVKVATVSRDLHAKIFDVKDGLVQATASHVYPVQVSLSSVAVLENGYEDSKPLIFFGCLNGAVYVFIEDVNTPLNVLTTHSHNVGVIRTDAQTKFVATGSWDKTACVYDLKTDKVIFKIFNHTESVNDVQFVRPTSKGGKLCLFTASSDKTISLWDISDEIQACGLVSPVLISTFYAHTDCVRAMMVEPDGNTFYTVSNDQLVIQWSINSPQPLRQFVGHEHFVYHIEQAPNAGEFMTCGEDRTIRVWSKERCQEVQTIKVPVISVWHLQNVNDNTILASTSSGEIYVYSKDSSKVPNRETIAINDLNTAKLNVLKPEDVGDLNLYEQSSLLESKPSVGERRLVRMVEDDSVMVWIGDDSSRWKPFGLVKEYSAQKEFNNEGKVFFNGDYYDDLIEFSSGKMKCVTALNRSDDPIIVAQKFINNNPIVASVDTIVRNIIEQQTYFSSMNASTTHEASNFFSREVATFDQFPTFDKIAGKFDKFRQEQADQSLVLSDVQYAAFQENFYKPSQNVAFYVDCYKKFIQWPEENRFMVFDMLRKHLTDKLFAVNFFHDYSTTFNDVMNCVQSSVMKPDLATQLTALRCFANCFSTVFISEFMFSQYSNILGGGILKWSGLVENKNVHLAFVAIYHNYSLFMYDRVKNQKARQDFLNYYTSFLLEGLEHAKFPEVMVKLLEIAASLITTNVLKKDDCVGQFKQAGILVNHPSVHKILNQISLL